ncbi:hypothetical protein HBH79_243260 [Parastagonospora nodorum]|nr:hypothetical protein HBH79_243260 [Parastagonospora nodorum]
MIPHCLLPLIRRSHGRPLQYPIGLPGIAGSLRGFSPPAVRFPNQCQHIVDSTRNSVFNNAERMWPCLDYVQGDSWVGRVHDEGETIEREVISMTSTQQPSPPRHARLYEEAGSG